MSLASRTVRLLALALALPVAAHAQSAQRISVQASLLYVMPSGSAYEGLAAGAGFEAQVRYNPSAFSLGIGFQQSSHEVEFDDGSTDDVTLSGPFIEPRYVIDIGRSNMAPYLAGRLAFLKQKIDIEGIEASASGTQINAGGGLLMRLSPRINLDFGATYGVIDFDDVEVSFEGETIVIAGSSGNGKNLVLRVGLAIGI